MRRKFISAFIALTMVLSSGVQAFAMELNLEESGNRESLRELNNFKGKATLKVGENGQVFLAGRLLEKQSANTKTALKFLEENKEVFHIDDAGKELEVVETKNDDLGGTFIKFQQTIKGLKIEDRTINMYFDKEGTLVSVNGELEENKEVTALGSEEISQEDAINIAKSGYTFKSLRQTPKAERMILNKDNRNYEVFKVNIFYWEPIIGNWDVYVEVNSGEVVKTESNIRYGSIAKGTGIDVLGVNRSLNLYYENAVYEMVDLTKEATESIVTFSANGSMSDGEVVYNTTNSFYSEDYKASVSAHYYAGEVIDFYKELFNRNSLDDNGMDIYSFTHFGQGYNNAFWDGYEMVYGDGDGEEFTYLSGDLDVVGHEMTHGVIEKTANLQYENQPGALNESMADVFGVLISTYSKYNVASGGSWKFDSRDWVVGDDIYTPNIPGDALRSLSNPNLYDQPDNMKDYLYLPNTEDGDWGGVHYNSGIPNKAAYLIAQNLGMKKTADIYYRALKHYMSPSTDFASARECLMQAAKDIFGSWSNEIKVIQNSYAEVGIGKAFEEPDFTGVGAIESPSAGEKVSGRINVTGWVLDMKGIESIKVYVDSNPILGDVIYGDSRPDIGALYPQYNNNNSGFHYELDTKLFDNGAHSINVIATNKLGQVTSLEIGKVIFENPNLPTGVTLDKTAITFNKMGDIADIIATVIPQNADNKRVLWSSSNNSVAMVDSNGKVTAMGRGTATITATTEQGGYTATCSVTVKGSSGWSYENGKWYYYNEDGTNKIGWLDYNGGWYYLDSTGAMVTGWALDKGNWYFMNSEGIMLTGWVFDGNGWYYLKDSGVMATGWINYGGAWYYLKGNGVMATGWAHDGNAWYYLKDSGVMATGWLNYGGTWYYLKSNGIMATGWLYDKNSWYYMNEDGIMQTGWILSGSRWYYLYGSGVMASNTTIDGYKLGKDGAWLPLL